MTAGSSSLSGKALYVLPIPRFFSQLRGIGGHVAHAHGVIAALADLGWRVDVVAEEWTLETPETARILLCRAGSSNPISRQYWNRHFTRTIGRIVQEAPPSFCYARYSVGYVPWMTPLKRALGRTPLAIEVNSLGTQRHSWIAPIERRALRAADVLICVSDALAQVVRSIDRRLENRLLVVPNGVALERFPDPAAPGESQGDRVRFGYVGSLKPGYGLETLLRAYALVRARLPCVALDIYGDGPWRGNLETLAAGIPGITFQGVVPFADVPRVLQELDVLVHTMGESSTYMSPVKLYEYMAASRPIVGAATPEVRSLLADGELGLLYPPGDESALANAMYIVATDAELRRRVAVRVRAEVGRHSWKARVGMILEALSRRGLLNV